MESPLSSKYPTIPTAKAQRVLIGAALIALAANLFVFGHVPGIGWALSASTVWAALLSDRWQDLFEDKRRASILATIMAATMAQTVIRPSGANLIALAALTAVLAAAHPTLDWKKLPGLLLGGLLSPFRTPHKIGRSAFTRSPDQHAPIAKDEIKRFMAVAAPAALTVLVFAILMIKGNGMLKLIFDHALSDTVDAFYTFEYPGIGRILFVLLTAVGSTGLLWKQKPLPLVRRVEDALRKSWRAPGDLWIASWRTRAILIAANVIFLVANTTDALYLWARTELPEELTLAQFVHQGTGNLIASSVIAGITLVVLFRQDREVTRQRGTTALGLFWIGQNLVLVSSVILRIDTYIDGYGLSLLRLYLILTMLGIAVGFAILGLGIMRQRDTGWIARNFVVAACFTIFALQFWDARAYVARTNFSLAQEWKKTHTNHLYIDARYVASLGSSAYPTLIKIAAGASGFAGNEIRNARGALSDLRIVEHTNAATDTWEDFSFHRRKMRALLIGSPPAARD